MRKIEEQMAAAIRAGEAWTGGNTTVTVENIRSDEDGLRLIRVTLHGHIIADLVAKKTGEIRGHVNFCGWVTPTTASRINAVLSTINSQLRVGRSKGQAQTRNLTNGACSIVADRFPILAIGRL